MEPLAYFTPAQALEIDQAVRMAEELVSNHYKMSANEWLRPKYDIKTMAHLADDEIVQGPFAQIIRYKGQPKNKTLGSSAFDFYKICLQDHAILDTLKRESDLELFPFALYIITHELIHIVRFAKFVQGFEATADEKMEEERRVHAYTHDILQVLQIPGIPPVLDFYARWRQPLEGLETS